MPWAFRSVGTAGSNFNGNMTPGAPAGSVSTDTLILFAWCVPGSVTIPDLSGSGWTKLSINTAISYFAIYGAPGGTAMPTFQYGPDFQGCFCEAWTGGSTTASRTGVERGVTTTNGVQFASYNAPADANVLIVGGGVRASGSANGVTFGSSGIYTTRASYVVDGRPHAILVDNIQTTPASASIVTVSTSPADSASQSAATELIFLLPASAFVPYPPMSLGGIGVQMCQ